MSAFIPNRREPEVTENALAKVREDKQREVRRRLRRHVGRPSRPGARCDARSSTAFWATDRTRRTASATTWWSTAADLTNFEVPGGQITEAGLRNNVSVGIRYIASWLGGVGAAALDNLMEDAATAEISRSQVWQWVKTGHFTRNQVLAAIEPWRSHDAAAAALFEQVALSDAFVEFLTLPAYEHLE